MRKRTVLTLFFTAFLVLVVAPALSPAYAAEAEAEGIVGKAPLATFGAAIALGFAAAFCGLGQGWSISSACQGIARNPGAGGAIRLAMLLGLAFIESLVIYVLVIAFIKG
jgi:F-type H+-transporting ATPase subunit c